MYVNRAYIEVIVELNILSVFTISINVGIEFTIIITIIINSLISAISSFQDNTVPLPQ